MGRRAGRQPKLSRVSEGARGDTLDKGHGPFGFHELRHVAETFDPFDPPTMPGLRQAGWHQQERQQQQEED